MVGCGGRDGHSSKSSLKFQSMTKVYFLEREKLESVRENDGQFRIIIIKFCPWLREPTYGCYGGGGGDMVSGEK